MTSLRTTSLCAMLSLTACGELDSAPAQERTGALALTAGAATVFDEHATAFSLPFPGLDERMLADFFVGNSFFNQNWVSAPASVTNRDGLGPLFNARSCSGCHFRDGRGQPPEVAAPGRGYLVRVSRAGETVRGGPLGDPVYGTQLQDHAIQGAAPEVKVSVSYREHDARLDDGTVYSLRTPVLTLSGWSQGEPEGPLRTSARVAPQIIGLGLLEAVPDATLVALADPDDRDGDGVSGRPNAVWDVERAAVRIGRFGWKAEQPSIRQQVAAALAGDLGLTTSMYPEPNHSAAQTDAARLPSGGDPEVEPLVLGALSHYARTLAVPARRSANAASAARGEALFTRIGCAACHVPTLHIEAVPELGLTAESFHPYSDLLLHDLGPGLADNRPAFAADGSEWRTPPLWGLGLVPVVNGHHSLLHDGRARGFVEAILWHAGEALSARQGFSALPRDRRADLVAFLESI